MIDVILFDDEIKLYDINYEYRKYLYAFDYKVNLKNNRRFMVDFKLLEIKSEEYKGRINI